MYCCSGQALGLYLCTFAVNPPGISHSILFSPAPLAIPLHLVPYLHFSSNPVTKVSGQTCFFHPGGWLFSHYQTSKLIGPLRTWVDLPFFGLDYAIGHGSHTSSQNTMVHVNSSSICYLLTGGFYWEFCGKVWAVNEMCDWVSVFGHHVEMVMMMMTNRQRVRYEKLGLRWNIVRSVESLPRGPQIW